MNIVRFLLVAAWIWVASLVAGGDFSTIVHGFMMLAIGLWAGYQDGKKAGKRELLTGSTE